MFISLCRDISCFQKGLKSVMVSEQSISRFLPEILALEIG
jgi:hypothetical protein